MAEETTPRLIRLEIIGEAPWNALKAGFRERADDFEFFRIEHAISPEVWEARPYVAYTAGNLEPVSKAFEGFAPNQRKWAENRARKSDGFIMVQYAVPGLDLLDIPPQLRPYHPILRGIKWDYHPFDDPPDDFIPVKPDGSPLPDKRRSRAWARRLHILRDKDPDDHHGAKVAARLGYDTPEKLRQLVNDPACEDDLLQILREANNEEVHCHEDFAKYLLTISPTKLWVHDHADYRKPQRLKDHLEKWHDGDLIVGEHDHGDKEVPDDNPRRSSGKRIDIHPLAWSRFADAEVVYFCIEGKVKADAALSEILRLDLPASVCSVPSVGQWDAHELVAFAMRDLAGKIVVVVCDADGCDNPEVMMQALLLEKFLKDPSLGVPAVGIASPPYKVFNRNKDYKGMDDHLLRASVGDLQMLGRKVPRRALAQWATTHAQTRINGTKIRRDRVRRDLRTMWGLSVLLGPGGQGQPSIKKLARFIGISDDRVEEALDSLIQLEHLAVDKPLATARWQFRSTDYQDSSLEWIDRPTIKLVDPACRSADLSPEHSERLSDWLERKHLQTVREGSKLTTDERIATAQERQAVAQERIAAAQELIAGAKKAPVVDEEAVVALFVDAIDAWGDADAPN